MELIKGKKYFCRWATFDRWGNRTGESSGALEFTGEYDDLTGAARMKDYIGGVEGYRLILIKDIF